MIRPLPSSVLPALALALFGPLAARAAGDSPLRNLRLDTDANGAGHSWTNLAQIHALTVTAARIQGDGGGLTNVIASEAAHATNADAVPWLGVSGKPDVATNPVLRAEADTLQSVVGRGDSTTQRVVIGATGGDQSWPLGFGFNVGGAIPGTNYLWSSNGVPIWGGPQFNSRHLLLDRQAATNARLNGQSGSMSNGMIYLPPLPADTSYDGDGLTIGRSGNRLHVQEWITDSVLLLRLMVEKLIAMTSLGLIDGPDYWHNDTNGILQAASSGWYWGNPGLRNWSTGGAFAPVVHYRCNDNAANTNVADSSGNGYSGACGVNTDTIATNGNVSGGLGIDAVDERVTISDSGALSFPDPAVTPFSVSCWLYRFAVGNCGIIQAIGGGTWMFYIDHGNDKMRIGEAGVYEAVDTGDAVGAEAWHHLVMVRTGTDVSFYLDGSFNSTVADSHTFSANQTHYVSDPVSGSWILNGIIDDLRVYDVALDADQVALIYNSGAGTETTALGGSAPAAMNLTSTTNTLDFVPTTCRTLVQLTDHEGTLAASQIVVQVSRDAGTTWGTASLGASVFSVSNYVWSANLSLTNQPSGSNVMLRAILTNGAPNCTVWGWAVPCGVEE